MAKAPSSFEPSTLCALFAEGTLAEEAAAEYREPFLRDYHDDDGYFDYEGFDLCCEPYLDREIALATDIALVYIEEVSRWA